MRYNRSRNASSRVVIPARTLVMPRPLAHRRVPQGESAMREAVIVSAARTAVGKAPRGALNGTRPDDLAAAVIKAAVERAPSLDPKEIDDVIIGCAMPEAEQGLNMARAALLRAGLPVEVPGQTVNRFCSSGLQTIALAAQQIMTGMGEVVVAGGAESMSLVPMTGNHFAPNPAMADLSP